MSGRRCKAIRKDFQTVYGRRPRKSRYTLTKDETRDKETGKLRNFFHFLGQRMGPSKMEITDKSEWRQAKRAYAILHKRPEAR